MDVRHWGEVERRSVGNERWESLRQRLALSRDLRDPDQMQAVLVDAAVLSEEQRRLLRAEVGVGLVRLGRFLDAQPLLREIIEADPDVRRPDAHVYYAQSLYRPKPAPRGPRRVGAGAQRSTGPATESPRGTRALGRGDQATAHVRQGARRPPRSGCAQRWITTGTTSNAT